MQYRFTLAKSRDYLGAEPEVGSSISDFTIKSKIKRLGNSLWVMVPKEVVEKEGLKEGEEVEISVRRLSDVWKIPL
jgi:Antidote-toxin recognition MazE, bacterial antitoxin